jgi:hypothetical protein
LSGTHRLVVAPDALEQRLDRDRLTGLERERREYGALFGWPEVDCGRPTVHPDCTKYLDT